VVDPFNAVVCHARVDVLRVVCRQPVGARAQVSLPDLGIEVLDGAHAAAAPQHAGVALVEGGAGGAVLHVHLARLQRAGG